MSKTPSSWLTLFWKHTPLMLLLLVGIVLFFALTMSSQYTDDPPQLAIDRDMSILSDLETDTVFTPLHAGDTVSVLGVREPSYSRPASVLVLTRDGVRGDITFYALGYPMLDKNSRDTVDVQGIDLKKRRYVTRKADGTPDDESFNHLNCELPAALQRLQLSGGYYYMSEKKFARLYVGKTLAECDRLYRPADMVAPSRGHGWQAVYNKLRLYNPKDGTFRNPVVSLNDSLVVTGYTLANSYGNNSWPLRWLPFVSAILDCDLLSWHIQEPLYLPRIMNFSSEYVGEAHWYHWVFIAIYLLLGIVWAFLMLALPVKILEALMHCRYTFYPLNDKVLTLLFGVVTAISAYVWGVLIMAWGLLWFVAWIVWPVALWVHAHSTRELDVQPHQRCEQCRRMYTMEFVKREFIREYDEWRTESKRGALLQRFTRHWTTYTQTTYSDGSTRNSNYQDHSSTHSVYAVHHYDVYYHVKEYHNVYRCSGCGHEERFRNEDLQELQRKHLGTSTVTE